MNQELFAVEVTEAKIRIWDERSSVDEADTSTQMLTDALEALKAQYNQEIRWPIVRSGEREPIIWPVRYAIGKRDSFTCRSCHAGMEWAALEVDHIIPWSAGGSHLSTNLRLLCQDCNRRRSNRVDGTEGRRVLPATWWCVECWTDAYAWRPLLGGAGTGVYDLNIKHRVDSDRVIAYCAHCNHISRTDVTL